jgi:hypothetical protein
MQVSRDGRRQESEQPVTTPPPNVADQCVELRRR